MKGFFKVVTFEILNPVLPGLNRRLGPFKDFICCISPVQSQSCSRSDHRSLQSCQCSFPGRMPDHIHLHSFHSSRRYILSLRNNLHSPRHHSFRYSRHSSLRCSYPYRRRLYIYHSSRLHSLLRYSHHRSLQCSLICRSRRYS